MLLQSIHTTATKKGWRRQRRGGLEANRETPFFLCPRLLSSREIAAPQRKDTPKCTSKCHPCRGGLNHVLSKFVLAHKKCNCVPTRECSVFASKNCVLTSMPDSPCTGSSPTTPVSIIFLLQYLVIKSAMKDMGLVTHHN